MFFVLDPLFLLMVFLEDEDDDADDDDADDYICGFQLSFARDGRNKNKLKIHFASLDSSIHPFDFVSTFRCFLPRGTTSPYHT